MLKSIINLIIITVVKIQFIPMRITNAMHIHKMKRELNKQIKELKQ